MKPEPENIFEQFLLLMAAHLSDLQAANISFLKIFLYGVKNAELRNATQKRKYKKYDLFDFELKVMVFLS